MLAPWSSNPVCIPFRSLDLECQAISNLTGKWKLWHILKICFIESVRETEQEPGEFLDSKTQALVLTASKKSQKANENSQGCFFCLFTFVACQKRNDTEVWVPEPRRGAAPLWLISGCVHVGCSHASASSLRFNRAPLPLHQEERLC